MQPLSLVDWIAYQVVNVLLGTAAIRVVLHLGWRGPRPLTWHDVRRIWHDESPRNHGR